MSIINIEEIPESLLQEETILSLFGLPNITSDNIETKAEELYSQLCDCININNEFAELINTGKYVIPRLCCLLA